MIDTSVVRVHQHGACITDNNHQDMGRSRGGLTSKIHAVVDTNGLPVRLALTPGEAHDNRLCSALLSGLLPQTMLLAEWALAGPTAKGRAFWSPSGVKTLSPRLSKEGAIPRDAEGGSFPWRATFQPHGFFLFSSNAVAMQARRPTSGQSSTKRAHTLRGARPLSLQKSAIVL